MLSQVKDVAKEDRVDNRANMNKNGIGYITKGQQGTMNQQENQINQEIKSDANAGQPPAATPPAAQ